jgi:hypothetical protein
VKIKEEGETRQGPHADEQKPACHHEPLSLREAELAA